MNLDKEYSERVTHGGTWDPFEIIKKILGREVANEDLNHLSITKKEAIAHLEITDAFLRECPNSKEFSTGLWKERTDLCKQYLNFLSEYEKGNDIREVCQVPQGIERLVYCSQCALAKQHKEGQYAGFTFCKHWQKYFLDNGDFCSHGIPGSVESVEPKKAEPAPKDVFAGIKEFFDSEKIPYHSTDYPDTIRFRAYGTSYSLQNSENGIIFCCKAYPTTESLIKAIDKECRGGDGTFGV